MDSAASEANGRCICQISGRELTTCRAFCVSESSHSVVVDTNRVYSIFPRLVYYITIPAHRNAALLEAPTANNRWPVMFFSHGLAGSRNMYSHICGSLASHGIVVVAMDHRDGSSPAQYVRATKTTEAKIIGPDQLPHTPSQEVYQGRDKQLRIRMWEIALAHRALLRIDKGWKLDNLDMNTALSKKERVEVLSIFEKSLDIHIPGRIVWAGHSFGAATMHQLVKTVFYNDNRPASASKPLFVPSANSAIAKQITTASPLAMLDLWGLPLHSPDQEWLWKKPLPCYSTKSPGGKALVGVLSEGFHKWTGNLNNVKCAFSPPATYNGPEPGLFYPVASQHFSQSDFGILFPWLTERFMHAAEPERVLKLNMRAVLQMMRNCGHDVAATSAADMDLPADKKLTAKEEQAGDEQILSKVSSVRGWTSIPLAKGMREPKLTTKDEKESAPPEFRAPEDFRVAMDAQMEAQTASASA